MYKSASLLSLIILILQVIYVVGQEEQCSRQYSGEVASCNAFVPSGTTIYVKNYTSYDALITALQKETSQIGLIPGECSALIMRYTCRSRLTECVKQDSLLYPRPNCMPVCSDASPTCDIFFMLGGNAANCNGTEPISGLPLFLEPNVKFSGFVNGTAVQVSCSNSTDGEYEAICNFPQAKKKNGQCGIACPDPMFTSTEYVAVDVIAKVGGWLSFFILLGVSVTYFLDPERKTWPMNIPHLLCISATLHSLFMVVLPTLLNIGKERNSHWCTDDATPARQEDASAACIMQSVAITYFAPHINGWLLVWTSIIIYQMLNIKKRGNMNFYPWGAVFCAILYLAPVISVVTAASYGKMGYPRGSEFCNFWVAEELGQKFPTVWTAATVTIPILIICCLISIELVVIMVLLYKAYSQVSKLRKTNKESSFSYEKKMIQYLVWNLVTQTAFFAFYFDSTAKFDAIATAYQEWIACLAVGTRDECSLKTRPAYWLFIVSSFAAVAYGGIGVFIFGLHLQVWKYWKPTILRYSSRFSTAADSASESKRKSKNYKSSGSGTGDRNRDSIGMTEIHMETTREESAEEPPEVKEVQPSQLEAQKDEKELAKEVHKIESSDSDSDSDSDSESSESNSGSEQSNSDEE